MRSYSHNSLQGRSLLQPEFLRAAAPEGSNDLHSSASQKAEVEKKVSGEKSASSSSEEDSGSQEDDSSSFKLPIELSLQQVRQLIILLSI